MADDNETLERIRKRAYELWETEGRPEGKENDHWVQATTEILGADNQHSIEVAPTHELKLSPDEPLSTSTVSLRESRLYTEADGGHVAASYTLRKQLDNRSSISLEPCKSAII